MDELRWQIFEIKNAERIERVEAQNEAKVLESRKRIAAVRERRRRKKNG